MKITRKEVGLLVTPLLVVGLAFILNGLNRSLIRQEEKAQLKPTLHPNGSVMISRQRQVDGSIVDNWHLPDGSKRVLTIRPANALVKPRGLFQKRYIVLGAVVAVALSLISLPVLVVLGWLQRGRPQARTRADMSEKSRIM